MGDQEQEDIERPIGRQSKKRSETIVWTVRIAGLILAAIPVYYIPGVKEFLKAAESTLADYRYLEVAGLLAAGIVIAVVRTKRLVTMKKELEVARRVSEKLEGDMRSLEARLKEAQENKEQAISEINLLKRTLNDCIPYKKDSKGRWETYSTVFYGHIDYPPFLRHYRGDPTGPAVELLKKLLEHRSRSVPIDVHHKGGMRNWDSIFDGLVNRDYDVVATPLFATFERSKKVRFTSPLFYSNIGLYIRKELADQYPEMRSLPADGIKDLIKTRKLDLLSIDGEISQKLAEKYAPGQSRKPLGPETALSDLFDEVAKPENGAVAFFCESYFAANLAKEEKKGTPPMVKNVLGSHEILYPVCFAVRIGDYQLASLLNIRLLELAHEEGILDFLIKLLPTDPDHKLDKSEISLHFAAQWPCPIDVKDGTNA